MADEGKKMVGSYDSTKEPVDTDLVLGYDSTENKVKNFKISKIFDSFKKKLGTAAFCAVVNNLTTNTENGVLDARQGKELNTALTNLKNLVGTTDISGIADGTITGAINELYRKGTTSGEILYYFSSDDFESGTYNGAGNKIENNMTIRTKNRYSVSVGDIVHFNDTEQYGAIAVFYDNSFHDIGGWTNGKTTIAIDHDGELIVLIRKDPNGTLEISPSEYAKQIYITKA